MNPRFTGKKHSEESKRKIGKKNEKHHNWQGDNVGYKGVHKWVRKNLLQPKLCKMCNEKPPYDLANITGIYNREFKNWKWLCRRCHQKSDGRLEKFVALAASIRQNIRRDSKTGRFIRGEAIV